MATDGHEGEQHFSPDRPQQQQHSLAATSTCIEAQHNNGPLASHRPTILPIQPQVTTIEHKMEPLESKRISGQWAAIVGHGALATVPMFMIATAILLTVIPHGIELQNVDGYSTKSYYFLRNVPPSTLLSLTACTAILSLLFISSLLTLTSFIHAGDMLRLSEGEDFASLPTALEFGLLLRVIGGSPVAYVRGVKQSFERPYKKHFILRRAVILSTAIAILCIAIIACDVWLHIATRALATQPFDQSTLDFSPNYGRQLSKECFPFNDTNSSTFEASFTDNGCSGRMDIILDGFEATRTALGQSALNEVVSLDFPGLKDFHYESVSILVDARAPEDHSFVASTYGVATMCVDISAECQVNETSYTWNCADHHFDGQMAQSGEVSDPAYLMSQLNVIKWVMAARMTGEENSFRSLWNDSEITINGGNLFAVMHCETAVYEVEYFKSGHKYIPQSITPSNTTTSKLIYSPMFPDMIESFGGFGKDILTDQFTVSATASKSKADLEHSWAQAFSSLTIASSAGIMSDVPVKQELTMITIVPKAAILTLWAATILYGVFALGLAVTATRNVSERPEVGDVQARMSFMGLVAHLLEARHGRMSARSTDDFFRKVVQKDDYTNRVRVVKTSTGGWVWETPPPARLRSFP